MSAIAEQRKEHFTAEQFLAFLSTRPDEERWQLIDGVAVMMNPPTAVHQLIVMNLALLLNQALQPNRPDLVALHELGLRFGRDDPFLPEVDLAVVQQPVRYDSYLGQFFLTAEVLSESNTEEYIELKQRRYSQQPDNLYSLVISQREMRVELRSRNEGWQPIVLRSPDDVLELPEFGLRCAVRELYRGTPLA